MATERKKSIDQRMQESFLPLVRTSQHDLTESPSIGLGNASHRGSSKSCWEKSPESAQKRPFARSGS